MSGKYGAGMTQTAVTAVDGATGTDAVGEIQGIATQRGWVYDLLFSQGAAPADTVVRWEVPRASTSATGGVVVENPLDLADGAASCLVEDEVTVGPTVTADTQILDFDLNQRATFRWVAAPGGAIILPATAAAGIFFNCSSATYTGIARCTVHWEE